MSTLAEERSKAENKTQTTEAETNRILEEASKDPFDSSASTQ